VAFRQEQGYNASPGAPMEHVDQFQLFINDGNQQPQHGIEQMQYHSGWGLEDNHFFN